MRECRNAIEHLNRFRSCDRCDTIICTVCNNGTICYGDCGTPQRKVFYEVRVLPREEFQIFDSLALPERAFPLYAFVDDVEVGEGRDDERFFKLVLFTIKAEWFDRLSLDRVTPAYWRTAGLEAEPSFVHIGASKWLLDSITSKVGGAVYFNRGNWVKLWIEGFEDEEERQQVLDPVLGIPATVYFNCDRLVSSVGMEGPSPMVYYVVRIQRVRPTQDGLLKLMRFKRRIARV